MTAQGLDRLPPALAGIDAPGARVLLAEARVVELDPGRYVFNLGDSCEAFFILLDGSVRVQLNSAAGREVTLYRVGEGGSCLLTTSCLFSRDRYPAEAVTETAVRAMAVPKRTFRTLLEASPSFREYVFDGFARRLADVIMRIEALTLTSVDSRLAAVLLDLHDRGVTKITHQELAVELGTAREVVSRHLKRMEAQGWLELGRVRLVVRDPKALRAIAAAAGV